MQELVIEGATIKFLDRLYELETLCFDHEAFTKRQLLYLLSDHDTFGLIARLNGEIVGFIIFRIESDEDTYGHIITINVSPNHRRRGIGQKLMKEMELILKQKGIVDCRLEVREGNEAALRLYRQLGYQEAGRLEGYYGKSHGLYLSKRL